MPSLTVVWFNVRFGDAACLSPCPLATGPDNYFGGRVSPDGRWILYDVVAKDVNANSLDRVLDLWD